MKTFKKFTLLLFTAGFLLGAAGTAFSQTTLGAKAGLNLSNLSMEDASDKNMLAGFHGGLFVNMPLSGSFSVQPELLFSQKGAKWTSETSIADSEVKLNLNYLEVPVNLVYNLAEDFDFQFGPYVGFLTNTKSEGTLTVGNVTYQTSDELDKDNFNTVDFGLQGGLRFFLKPVYLGFTYKLGLSQVAKEGEFSEDVLGNAANQVIQVYAGIPF